MNLTESLRKLSSKKKKNTLDIQTLKHLAYRLNISSEVLCKVAEIKDTQYRYWYKTKKKGNKRKISSPLPRLKRIQKSIQKLLNTIVLSNNAHGGIKGRSNFSNAEVHSKNTYVYSLDFKNFYPNISHHRVFHLFRHELNCSPVVSSLLTKLCTINGEVPQGGPMSTDIANLVCRDLDNRVENLSCKYNIKYTRYVDDMYFSGEYIPKAFRKKLKEIIGSSCFKLNDDKETLLGKHQSQLVTGLSINNKKPNVPRKIKRKWRQEKYFFEKYGAKELSIAEKVKMHDRLRGKFNYMEQIIKQQVV